MSAAHTTVEQTAPRPYELTHVVQQGAAAPKAATAPQRVTDFGIAAASSADKFNETALKI